MEKITKKDFHEKCYVARYGKHVKAIFYDWKAQDPKSTTRGAGYKFMVRNHNQPVTQKELFDVIYNWVVYEKEPPYYIIYRYAMNDACRFKVPIVLSGLW